MTIPDKEKLFAKLENDGEKLVREKLAQGLYAGDSKISLIKEWLRQKEEERNNTSQDEITFLQRKGVRLSAIAILVALLGIVIAKWF